MDRERQFAEAMADFDRAHVRLLNHIWKLHHEGGHAPSTEELVRLPWVWGAPYPLLGALQRHGAIYQVEAGSPYGHGLEADATVRFDTVQPPGGWVVTAFAVECLKRLWAAGLESNQLESEPEDES